MRTEDQIQRIRTNWGVATIGVMGIAGLATAFLTLALKEVSPDAIFLGGVILTHLWWSSWFKERTGR